MNLYWYLPGGKFTRAIHSSPTFAKTYWDWFQLLNEPATATTRTGTSATPCVAASSLTPPVVRNATLFDVSPPLAGLPPVEPPADPIWGPAGLGTQIIDSLKGINPSMFASRDFLVTDYGAQACSTVPATNPYTDPTKSPLSVGADATHAPGSFDSRPAFLAAIAACNSAGGVQAT